MVAFDSMLRSWHWRVMGTTRKFKPSYEFDTLEIARVGGDVAGIDEAGRGPWAGPVVAAAVVLDACAIPPGIDDSKALDEHARETAYAALLASGARIGIGIADVGRIDRMNILNATLWAMRVAVSALGELPRAALVDGNRAPVLDCAAIAVVDGDARSLSIAAASIVAKVTRDRLMVELGLSHPDYGFERHKGYGTPEHKSAIERFGVTPHHRRSFRPVRLALGLAD